MKSAPKSQQFPQSKLELASPIKLFYPHYSTFSVEEALPVVRYLLNNIPGTSKLTCIIITVTITEYTCCVIITIIITISINSYTCIMIKDTTLYD